MTGQQRGDRLVGPLLPQRVQQSGDLHGVLDVDVLGGAGSQHGHCLVAGLPQRGQQPGDALRVIDGGVLGGVTGQQRGDRLVGPLLPQRD